MAGTDLTILVALAAGVISFLSPCVLPLVPAYLGQLTAIAVAASADGVAAVALARGAPRARLRRRVRGRLHAPRHHRDVRCGSAGRLPAGAADDRRRRPHRPRPRPRRASCASRPSSGRGGRSTRAPPGRSRPRPARSALGAGGGGPERRRPARRPVVELARRLAGVVRARGDLRDRLDAVHRDHPGRDPDDGRDVRHGRPGRPSCSSPTRSVSACRSCSSPRSTTGRRALLAPLVRHGRAVSLIGGLLVAFIGVAMVFDWLALLPRYFKFNTAI